MVIFSTCPCATRSRNVLNAIESLAPLAVLNRLQRRKTSTMITTHRSAVLTVEFNDCLLRGQGRCFARATYILRVNEVDWIDILSGAAGSHPAGLAGGLRARRSNLSARSLRGKKSGCTRTCVR